MTKKTITVTHVKCDICGSECEPVDEVSIPVAYYGEFVTTIKFKPYVYAPYATPRGDVCKNCLVIGLQKYIKESLRGD